MKRKRKARIISEVAREKWRANIAKAREARTAKKMLGSTNASVDIKQTPPEIKPEGTRWMSVSKLPINTRVVFACEDGDTVQRVVYVGNSANFVVGDKIDVKPHPQENGIWNLISPLPAHRRRPLVAQP